MTPGLVRARGAAWLMVTPHADVSTLPAREQAYGLLLSRAGRPCAHWRRAPYFHHGSAKDLVAFLKAL